ncbi:MAG: aldo/keto reductase, partial [Gaiellaceae bacterium]
MEHVTLGDSGLSASRMGLGCNNFGGRIDDRRATDVVHTALDLGVNLFDTADIYDHGAAESALAVALQPFRRQDLVLATKLFWP